MSANSDPKPIADLLRTVLHRSVLDPRRKVEAVRIAWAEVAGEEISRRSSVRSLRRGALSITVASASLCHHLDSFRKTDLLVALQKAAPRAGIQEIKFRIGDP